MNGPKVHVLYSKTIVAILSDSPSPLCTAQGNTGTRTISIVVPTVLGILLVLGLLVVAGLILLAFKRRREKPPTNLSPVIFTNNAAALLENPMYMEPDALLSSTDGSVASSLHFDPRVNGEIENDGDDVRRGGAGGQYMMIPPGAEYSVFANSFADSSESLDDPDPPPPHYSKLQHRVPPDS